MLNSLEKRLESIRLDTINIDDIRECSRGILGRGTFLYQVIALFLESGYGTAKIIGGDERIGHHIVIELNQFGLDRLIARG